MPFSGDTFTHLFDWEKDPQRQEKIVNSRLEAEFDGVDTGLSSRLAKAGGTTNPAAGDVGNFQSNQLLQADAVSLTSNVGANVTSFSNLAAGNYLIWGVVNFAQDTTTNLTGINCGLTTTSATLPSADDGRTGENVAFTTNSTPNLLAQPKRYNLTVATTIYLVARAAFTVSFCKASGSIFAIRLP